MLDALLDELGPALLVAGIQVEPPRVGLRVQRDRVRALFESDPDPKIRVSYDAAARTITVSDNGIGMSRQEVVEHIGTIARSGTREFLTRLASDAAKGAHLIGQFGVGFYSSFIVAERGR